MEMQQVRYLVTFAELLNFTRVAEACNATQPAFSRAIQQLEQELGGPLVNGERGNLHLTELGLIMLPCLAQIDEQARSARDLARSATRLDSGMLRIGAMSTIGAQVLAQMTFRFRDSHPNVEISMIKDEALQLLALLEQGELEVAGVGIPEELPGHFQHLPIFDERPLRRHRSSRPGSGQSVASPCPIYRPPTGAGNLGRRQMSRVLAVRARRSAGNGAAASRSNFRRVSQTAARSPTRSCCRRCRSPPSRAPIARTPNRSTVNP